MYVTAMVSIPKTQRVALSLPLLLTVWLALSGLVLAVGGCLGGDPPPPDFPPPPPPTAQTPPPRQDLPVIVPVPEPSQDCDEPLHEPSPDAAPEPEPWPEPSPDAGVPDAAPLPPDAAPEPVGPCEWVMDSTELVAPGAAWMFGYFPEATIASEGGLVIGRSNVPEQGSNFEAFADEWGIAPCASAGIDYWHYGGSMDFPGNWAVQCRQTEVWLDFPEGAWDTRIWLSPVDSALLHMRHSAATSWAPTFISESPSLYAQFPMGDDPGRVSFLAEPSAAPGYAHDPTNRWKIRAARFMTDGPVDGECPEPTSWTPQRPACAAQGCDEP